jgi:hypothetical protein
MELVGAAPMCTMCARLLLVALLTAGVNAWFGRYRSVPKAYSGNEERRPEGDLGINLVTAFPMPAGSAVVPA